MTICKFCQSKDLRVESKHMYDDRYGYPGFFDIYYCPNCTGRQTEPRLQDAELSSLYTQYYPTSSFELKSRPEIKNNLLERLRRWWSGEDYKAFYHLSSKKTILDIGCGSGNSLLYAEALGCQAVGIEENSFAKQVADHFNLQILIGNIYNVKLEDKKFDTITASQVIEHIPDPHNFLTTTKQKLKDDGRLIVSFPNTKSIYRWLTGRRWIHWHIPYHQNHFSLKSFTNLAEKNGWLVQSSRSITPTDWTVLQLLSLKSNSKNMWKPKANNGESNISKKRIKSYFKKMPKKILRFFISFINRMIDILGLGESLLIILKKTN